MPSDRIPPFFLLKMSDELGSYYVVCQSIMAVDEGALPGGVRSEIDAEFKRSALGSRAEVCELPDPREDGSSWIALQTRVQVKPGPGGGG
jgi:hypothetical protein